MGGRLGCPFWSRLRLRCWEGQIGRLKKRLSARDLVLRGVPCSDRMAARGSKCVSQMS